MKIKKEVTKKSICIVLFIFILFAVGCASSGHLRQMYLPAENVRTNLKDILKSVTKEAKNNGWEVEYESEKEGRFELVKNLLDRPIFVLVTFEAYKKKEFLVKFQQRPENSVDANELILKIQSAIKKAAKVE